MMQARYIETLLHNCSDQKFGQEAVEWAVLSGFITLTYDLQLDLTMIMGEPNLCPACHSLNEVAAHACRECHGALPEHHHGHYDDICAAYRRACADQQATLAASYAAAGLFEEILRPYPPCPSAISEGEMAVENALLVAQQN